MGARVRYLFAACEDSNQTRVHGLESLYTLAYAREHAKSVTVYSKDETFSVYAKSIGCT